MAWHVLSREFSQRRQNHLLFEVSGTGHTCLQQQLTEHTQKTLPAHPKTLQRKKKQKERQFQSFLCYMQTQ